MSRYRIRYLRSTDRAIDAYEFDGVELDCVLPVGQAMLEQRFRAMGTPDVAHVRYEAVARVVAIVTADIVYKQEEIDAPDITSALRVANDRVTTMPTSWRIRPDVREIPNE